MLLQYDRYACMYDNERKFKSNPHTPCRKEKVSETQSEAVNMKEYSTRNNRLCVYLLTSELLFVICRNQSGSTWTEIVLVRKNNKGFARENIIFINSDLPRHILASGGHGYSAGLHVHTYVSKVICNFKKYRRALDLIKAPWIAPDQNGLGRTVRIGYLIIIDDLH